MTTPHEGPPRVDFNNLSETQRVALERAIRAFEVAAPIYNAVNRVRELARQTAERLSERAQQLAVQAREFGQATAARAGELRDATVNRATEFGQQVAGAYQRGRDATVEAGQQAAAAYQRGRDATVDFAQRGAVAADLAAQVAAERVQATGRTIAEGAGTARQAVVQGTQNTGRAIATGAGTARQAVVDGAQKVGEAARQAYARASRWFQEKRSNGANRAEAARAAFSAMRTDPTMNRAGQNPDQVVISRKDALALSAQIHNLVNATTPEAQRAAAEELQRSVEVLQGPSGGGRHRAAAATDLQAAMTVANSGVAPPRVSVDKGEAKQTAQEQPQGEAQRTGAVTHSQPKGSDLTK